MTQFNKTLAGGLVSSYVFCSFADGAWDSCLLRITRMAVTPKVCQRSGCWQFGSVGGQAGRRMRASVWPSRVLTGSRRLTPRCRTCKHTGWRALSFSTAYVCSFGHGLAVKCRWWVVDISTRISETRRPNQVCINNQCCFFYFKRTTQISFHNILSFLSVS